MDSILFECRSVDSILFECKKAWTVLLQLRVFVHEQACTLVFMHAYILVTFVYNPVLSRPSEMSCHSSLGPRISAIPV